MKLFILAAMSVLITNTIYAGPACCGAGAKSKKRAVNDAGNSSSAKSGKAACSADELSKYFKSGKRLTTSELNTLLEAKADIVLVDARTPKWDDGKRIGSAKNLTPQSNDADIEAALGAKSAHVVTYCGSIECPLSHKMADRLKAIGYENVLVYPEGVVGWVKAGHAVSN